MPFLGSTPAEQYQSLAKQTITGDGSTAYTLNQSVTNAYDMEVFINNVRQEPDTSYTASGNTITFTAAVNSADSCYVIFQGKSVGTINPPANSVGTNEVVSGGLQSDAIGNLQVTHAKLHTDMNLGSKEVTLPVATSNPSSTTIGRTYFNSSSSKLFIYNGTEFGAVTFAALGSQANPATNAQELIDEGITTSGMYYIKAPGMTNPQQIYCDMSDFGGGWMLIAYGHVPGTSGAAQNIPNLNHDADDWTYTPTSRANDNGVAPYSSALHIARNSTEFMMCYNSGATVTTGGPNTYSHVYKFNIPNPSALTFANHTAYYNSSMGVSTVTVTGLKGQTGTWTRYTITESLGASWSDSYPTRYGVSSGSNPRSANTNDGPAFTSIHSGSGHSGNPSGQSSPDIGMGGYGGSNLTYTYQGLRNATSSNNTGATAIWVR